MSWLDTDTTEDSVSNFDLNDFREESFYERVDSVNGGCDCGCGGVSGGCEGCIGGCQGAINGGCEGCGGHEEQEHVGGAHPLIFGPAIGVVLIIIGILLILYFYYSDEADPAGWIPDMNAETKYWGARAGAITGMIGVAVAAAVPVGYMLRATKLWGLAFALIVIGIIILVVSFVYTSQQWMIDVFGPANEDAVFWSKITGGIILSVGLLPIVGKAIFVGGRATARMKGRMDQYKSVMRSDKVEDYSYQDDEDEQDIYDLDQHDHLYEAPPSKSDNLGKAVDIGSKVYSQNKSQIDRLVSQGMSKFQRD